LIVVGAVLLCSAVALAADTPSFSIAPSLVKVRPDQPLSKEARAASAGIDLKAARGECEAAHLVATAGAGPLQGLEVNASQLKRAGEKKTIEVRLYREAFLDLKTASDIEGATGRWPDPLIPVVDSIVGEKRNAFPIDVPARQHQPVFVEVCVPRSITPGKYVGTLTATAAKQAATKIPIRVEVLAVTIPATSSLPVTFGVSGKSLLFGHYGEKRKDDERLKLTERYARAALQHRISLHGMSMIPPVAKEEGGFDFSAWDAEIGPYMDGTALPDGARFSAIDLRTPNGLTGEALAGYYKAVVEHFKQKHWDDRLFAYVMDEPKKDQMAELVSRLDALAPYHSTIRRLVTTPFQPSLARKVDVWTPNINCLAYKQKPNEFCENFTPLATYAPLVKQGQKLWWYQSCSSHGCKHGPFGTAIDQYFTGWPSYMIDIDGGANRIMEWQTFANGVGGELYFDVAYAYNLFEKSRSPRQDPWDSVWAFGGNGDGTLFYPGRPEKVGGKTDIPIESLRLKLIRDGLEDYELLHALSSRDAAGSARAKEIATRMAPKPYQFERSPAAFDRSHSELLELLSRNDTLAPRPPRARPSK
jgi:hypothetical protein